MYTFATIGMINNTDISGRQIWSHNFDAWTGYKTSSQTVQ